ncbi:MAG TPA: sigma 54-interacting transcriptional regulator [Kofleriaceae bacterium]|nr:sigma 54-interacting transcriptional regulator [Kofleriaceae bacterium]
MNAPHPRLRSPDWHTRVLSTTPRALQIQRFRIEVIGGPNRGQVAVADGEELSVGTAPTNDLVLTDSTVSRHHMAITATPFGFQLRDLSSTDGTFLADYRVEVAYIDAGAVIQAGESTLRFEALDEQVTQPLSELTRFGDVLGESSAMRRVFAALERVAPTDAPVLLEGETGTGKGALAAAIHQHSARAAGPFVVVDCAATPAHMLESELFGHEAGAFPGAEQARGGAFGAAQGGTLFLDGIGEMSAEMQRKLALALETRLVSRIGSGAPEPIDVRVVAASNRDLRPEVNADAFRTDLFHRLAAARVAVPALRERPEDVALLAAHFYRQAGGGEISPSDDLLQGLVRQPWPGNLRELRGAAERLADQAAEEQSGGRDESWPALDFTISFRESKEGALAVWTRVYVRQLVDRYGGNLSRAARAVSMDRNHLRDLLHKYAMNSADPA